MQGFGGYDGGGGGYGVTGGGSGYSVVGGGGREFSGGQGRHTTRGASKSPVLGRTDKQGQFQS